MFTGPFLIHMRFTSVIVIYFPLPPPPEIAHFMQQNVTATLDVKSEFTLLSMHFCPEIRDRKQQGALKPVRRLRKDSYQ